MNVVLSELHWHIEWARSAGRSFEREAAVVKHGRSYIGVKRLKNFRQRARKQCFVNAGRLALDGRGTYVEGFAMSPTSQSHIHHAWITLDGENALDVTWPDASKCSYLEFHSPKNYWPAFVYLANIGDCLIPSTLI